MNPFATQTKRATVLGLSLLAGLGALLGLHAPRACAQAEVPEYQLKAAFIYNFAKFVTWPSNAFETPASPLIVAVLGDDPFGPMLPQMLAGKTVNGRPIQINNVPRGEAPPHCHILYVTRSEKERLASVLKAVAGRPVLTVGEFERFAHNGGMINLFLDGKAVRFEINVNATERTGFKVSPKLGGLGTMVRGEVVEAGGAK